MCITTLGYFEVRKDEALGRREVSEAYLADALWPDAEGSVVYHRCAKLLKQVLGCTPSTETEALRRDLTHH